MADEDDFVSAHPLLPGFAFEKILPDESEGGGGTALVAVVHVKLRYPDGTSKWTTRISPTNNSQEIIGAIDLVIDSIERDGDLEMES